MTDEQRAIETLTSIAKVYKATSNIEDDGSEDAMTQALRRDLPIALEIIDRQESEIKSLKADIANWRSVLRNNELLIAEMSVDCTCGACYIDEIAEEELIPLSPELEALPDIQGFAASQSRGVTFWEPIIGKRIEVNGIIAILHAVEGFRWRLIELTSGRAMGTDSDPQNAIDKARGMLDDATNVALVRMAAKEKRALMPPNPELDAIIEREAGARD